MGGGSSKIFTFASRNCHKLKSRRRSHVFSFYRDHGDQSNKADGSIFLRLYSICRDAAPLLTARSTRRFGRDNPIRTVCVRRKRNSKVEMDRARQGRQEADEVDFKARPGSSVHLKEPSQGRQRAVLCRGSENPPPQKEEVKKKKQREKCAAQLKAQRWS